MISKSKIPRKHSSQWNFGYDKENTENIEIHDENNDSEINNNWSFKLDSLDDSFTKINNSKKKLDTTMKSPPNMDADSDSEFIRKRIESAHRKKTKMGDFLISKLNQKNSNKLITAMREMVAK
mmetsp:Transcript_15995/g.13975  ORF Transcript_15995/g.13975 Transcript_15995/m.13975 type:complete len:123 (+) Transcript_15995:5-373(+)